MLLAEIGSAIEQAIEEGCTSSTMIYEKPLAQNVNLLQADYCYAERKERWEEECHRDTLGDLEVATKPRRGAIEIGSAKKRRTGQIGRMESW